MTRSYSNYIPATLIFDALEGLGGCGRSAESLEGCRLLNRIFDATHTAPNRSDKISLSSLGTKCDNGFNIPELDQRELLNLADSECSAEPALPGLVGEARRERAEREN